MKQTLRPTGSFTEEFCKSLAGLGAPLEQLFLLGYGGLPRVIPVEGSSCRSFLGTLVDRGIAVHILWLLVCSVLAYLSLGVEV